MDPFAHTFTAAALAAGGLRKTTPLATAALLIGANAPDIDILVAYAGDYMSLAHRRGWTHGVLAWLILPIMLTGLLMLWDKWVRRRQDPGASPARWPTLMWLAALAVLTHPALDWLNNYGIRLLMPLDGRWFYGDALFIIDPWVWLLVGGAAFLYWSRGAAGLAGWGLFWFAASLLIIDNGLVPEPAKILWFTGLAILLAIRIFVPDSKAPLLARCSLVLLIAYSLANAGTSATAEQLIRRTLGTGALEVHEVMVGPLPANPLSGVVVVETTDGYRLGKWRWLETPHLSLSPQTVAKNLQEPAVNAARNHPHARRFLTWSRFPYAEIVRESDGIRVSFGDARYAGFEGGIGGPTITLNGDLHITAN